MKMATYAGMNLRGEVRESVSLDEDDLSDVEDEVFIRDGKNGYKLAEELNVKRPLMAPRRKVAKSEAGSRLKPKYNCRMFCKPCCYVFAALSVLIGLIALVVVLVSIYPLPLDKLRDWIISKSKIEKNTNKLLPCSNIKVTDVWTVNLPKLTTDSPVRTLDVNGDGVDDVLFGFGTGGNYNVLPPDMFCLMFMGVEPPCRGGVIALNGTDGRTLWKHWLNDTIFSLQCTADLNGDRTSDCLAIGEYGTIVALDSKTGSTIWRLNTGKLDVGNFIDDCNGDNVSDVITSHSSLEDAGNGDIIILSGKNGDVISRAQLPKGDKSFFMPEVLRRDQNGVYILYGTGGPNRPGNLSVVPLKELMAGNLINKSETIYEDKYKGMLTQPILVDITGDNEPDIVSSMYNSTTVAIDGLNFRQIWNYTLDNAVTNLNPTPGYFNSDNVTDFLIIYQQYDNILNYNYTQTLIIDGKTGQPIYSTVSGGVITQMSGLTLRMESYGYDVYLFWTSECAKTEPLQKYDYSADPLSFHDQCKEQFNSSTVYKLNALNEFQQPPGVAVYTSLGREALEYNVTSLTRDIREYFKNFPTGNGQSAVPKGYDGNDVTSGIRKYGKSNFRHKDRPSGIIKDYSENGNAGRVLVPLNEHDDVRVPDYTWPNQMLQEDMDPEFDNYQTDDDGTIPYNQKQIIFDEAGQQTNNRDPRSKSKENATKSKKKNLSDKIYGYRNVRLSKNRLLHDDENLPTDILRDTYFKNEENRLKKSRFEQRDVNTHADRSKADEEVRRILKEEKEEVINGSLTLWDLEAEKEIQERQNGFYKRDKRNVDRLVYDAVTKITSVGAVLSSNSSNAIDVVFIKYWQSPGKTTEDLLDRYVDECVAEKIDKPATADDRKRCLDERNDFRRSFKYVDELSRLRPGQMTVYRLRIECECESLSSTNVDERCVRFLPGDEQNWGSYLGKFGNAVFRKINIISGSG